LTGANPVDRGKPGPTCHLPIDATGTPLAVGLWAANTHDSLLLLRRRNMTSRIARRGVESGTRLGRQRWKVERRWPGCWRIGA
jgi:hypothetical protein